MDPEKKHLYILFSNQKFAWVYSYRFTDDDTLIQDEKDKQPVVVYQSNAKDIYWLNSN